LSKEISVDNDENKLNINEIYHSLSSFFLKPLKNEIIIIIYDNYEIPNVKGKTFGILVLSILNAKGKTSGNLILTNSL